jgi:hypothetical protein|tara:strand:+ start:520 stop:915 length:396 start_codon:yes stop_codon:yes gene_type:complete
MLPEKIQNKELTSQQKTFISLLFGKAQGNPKKAGELAGYAPSSYPKVVKALKDEIIAQAEYSLALHSAKAVKGLVDALDEDGMTPAANIRMEAAKQILDRVGLVKKEKIDINAQVAHGIFILPPKDGTYKA